ncbi:maltose phosphorylase [Caloranaerobacter sp. TR13]|uniref:glycoside hydrolase family 65 protein n=1 Tax=Caloranaerobacter sp. TR13 TaxID=1302151 RepID=UPI0006D495B4|nr:glycoside hydrolase family 65 protein [Caloranaerobacter sp. TR13]KPU27654.1 maltose phosphorylase [Caloranaerobacter sp. TR13]
MKQYFKIDEWNIIEENLHPEENRIYESIMSLGNGHMGIRGNFEEDYSGDTLQGTYIAGVYYPDKTKVGWWKNGYPEYFAKVLNATNFIGIKVLINGVNIDLAKVKVRDFKRILNMKNGYLLRSFTIIDSKNRETKIEVKRFLSMSELEIAAISYSITPLNHDADISLIPYLDGDVSNEDSNYNEKFWLEVNKSVDVGQGFLTMKTKKLDFHVTCAMKYDIKEDGNNTANKVELIEKEKYVGNKVFFTASKGKTYTLYKYISVTTNRDYDTENIESEAIKKVNNAYSKGFDVLLNEHILAWERIWKESDVVIEGDVKAQQGIRFNIFQLNQTYTGHDPRLNIGPKGFTGEKYGGSTYWDTEAFCFPFYLSTSDQSIARNLLIYRYNHLEKAKENARKLGLNGALYPMVTMNGEECHNEWEITFEEIHRNAAISYAIFNYVRYTDDKQYLLDYGFEVLVETSRFWADRVNYNPRKDKYMILGVTGPNEYENNVNNNWYTNTMAAWNLEYTLEVMKYIKNEHPDRFEELKNKLKLQDEELEKWQDIIDKMYYPYVESLKVFEQQDGYMDKELLTVNDIPKEELPINKHWSWDRILRSCFIKQADVIQGLYFLNDRFDLETKKRNFDFYEPKTVHESSLSPCIYSIIASEIGYEEKAYELYLRTARLDLDNYNKDTDDGLHITSMSGSWLAIVHGFAGMRIKDGILSFSPFIPKAWNKYSFKIIFREHLLKVTVDKEIITIEQEEGDVFTLRVYNKEYTIPADSKITINIKKGA